MHFDQTQSSVVPNQETYVSSKSGDDENNSFDQRPIVITNYSELSKHVGKIVTIRGVQSRTKSPQVLGVVVNGSYDLSDKMVEVTGLLQSYKITQADVDAYDESQKRYPTASLRPVVGIDYALIDPLTRDKPKTRLYIED